MRATLLSIGLLFAALGLLTVFRAPDWVDWRLAVIAGQFGYALALVPLAAGVLAWYLPGDKDLLCTCACAACVAAAALLLQPCAQAWEIARSLPVALGRSFGPAKVAGEPFTFESLVRR